MKLQAPSWKTAWYEEGLSDRFAQEMSRQEKTTVREIGSSAQWVEHLLIELGQLAQNMIHLEGEARREMHLKLAFEKALKLSALASHLVSALDQALDQGPSLLRIGEAVPGEDAGMPALNREPGAPPPRVANPPAAAPERALTPPTAAAPGPRMSAATQVGIQRQAMPRDPAPGERAPAFDGASLASLIQVSGPVSTPEASSKNPMREMILALSRRGLSRSEIEVITEQPRHIIEAVLAAG